MNLGRGPSPEQLRTLDVRQIRDTFEMGLVEAKRLKKAQLLRDDIDNLNDEEGLKVVLHGLLELEMGER
jgi:hypothetical protein